MILVNTLLKRVGRFTKNRRLYSQKYVAVKKNLDEKDDPSLIRNIGILAHIDAGKTTTTERMLFFSGKIDNMGEVHHGNTVTDFMEQERERGITITAACVTFPWDKHSINLLDTPGHVDFSMEVEQTLNVMDGAVIVLDGSAGVEAQTVTVWNQADRYKLPRLVYINKMDRPDAVFFQSVKSVEMKLKVEPMVIQLPYFDDSKAFEGVIDVVNMNFYKWDREHSGTKYTQRKIVQEDGNMWEKALNARVRLTETLATLDENVAELILSREQIIETFSTYIMKDSIRKVTESQTGVPILCGSSYKNIGVQLLMNAIIQYLPSPVSSKSSLIMECFGNKLCARAFKVRHDPHKGAITFFRIYSGSISKGQSIYNMRVRKSEKVREVMVAYADDYEELDCVGRGNIAAVVGLEITRVGDLIASSAADLGKAEDVLASKSSSKQTENNKKLNEKFAIEAYVPDPVFFCSIEAPSSADEASLEKALAKLEREDPSLRVTVNEETNQTILSGMGELHLDVIKDRIRKEYGIDVGTGPLQISYKEKLLETSMDTLILQHKIGKNQQFVKITLSTVINDDPKKDILIFNKSKDSAENISKLLPKQLVAVKHGLELCLRNGPKLLFPVVNVQANLHSLEVGRGTSESMISAAANKCLKNLLKTGNTRLLEPFMKLEIVCNMDLMQAILTDIGKRRGELVKTEYKGTDTVIEALVPLSELRGYSTDIRILTSGRASFTMEFHSYIEMNEEDERIAIRRATGFDPL